LIFGIWRGLLERSVTVPAQFSACLTQRQNYWACSAMSSSPGARR